MVETPTAPTIDQWSSFRFVSLPTPDSVLYRTHPFPPRPDRSWGCPTLTVAKCSGAPGPQTQMHLQQFPGLRFVPVRFVRRVLLRRVTDLGPTVEEKDRHSTGQWSAVSREAGPAHNLVPDLQHLLTDLRKDLRLALNTNRSYR